MALITPANAREMAAKSLLARKQRSLAPTPTTPIPLEPIAPADNNYNQRRLTRVRQQLAMVDQSIEAVMSRKVVNGQNLNWLCSAQERLSEQERTLAGRPLPGSMRPSPAPTRRQSQAYTAPMIEDDVAPQPAAPEVTKPKTYDGPETG